jgi:hypothetical protein
MQQIIDLCNELHDGVFDAIVDHLDEMASASLAHPGHTGRAIMGNGGGGFQQWL